MVKAISRKAKKTKGEKWQKKEPIQRQHKDERQQLSWQSAANRSSLFTCMFAWTDLVTSWFALFVVFSITLYRPALMKSGREWWCALCLNWSLCSNRHSLHPNTERRYMMQWQAPKAQCQQNQLVMDEGMLQMWRFLQRSYNTQIQSTADRNNQLGLKVDAED